VIDAYATVKVGDMLHTVRLSGALGPDRMHQQVGPYRIEVIEPLQKIRLVCDADDHGVGFDLTWDGSFAAVEEQHHLHRHGTRAILDACRFAQVGSWSGVLRVGGDEITVDPSVWMGTRDRSWGIRPVGEPDPPGRSAAEPNEGFWWLYVPLRFDDYQIIVMAQEKADGYRTLNDAKRVWADGRIEQLGWPTYDITYRHDAAAIATMVGDGDVDAAILLPPVTVTQIRAAADARVRMPQKTTFFAPKPRTGLVLRPPRRRLAPRWSLAPRGPDPRRTRRAWEPLPVADRGR